MSVLRSVAGSVWSGLPGSAGEVDPDPNITHPSHHITLQSQVFSHTAVSSAIMDELPHVLALGWLPHINTMLPLAVGHPLPGIVQRHACKRCELARPLREFPLREGGARYNTCMSCKNAIRKAWRARRRLMPSRQT